MRAFLDSDIDPKPRRQRLLEPYTNTQSDDGGETAMGDGRSDEDGSSLKSRVRPRWYSRLDRNVWQRDHRQRAEGEGMFWIGDGGDQVKDLLLVDGLHKGIGVTVRSDLGARCWQEWIIRVGWRGVGEDAWAI